MRLGPGCSLCAWQKLENRRLSGASPFYNGNFLLIHLPYKLLFCSGKHVCSYLILSWFILVFSLAIAGRTWCSPCTPPPPPNLGVSELPCLLLWKSLPRLWGRRFGRHGWHVLNASHRTHQTSDHFFAAAKVPQRNLLSSTLAERQTLSVPGREDSSVHFSLWTL